MAELVTLEVESGIGTIRLNRPPVNALNRQMREEIRQAADAARDSPEVRAVVVYGGEKAFSVGADVKEFAAMTYTDMRERAQQISSTLGAMAEIPKPTVAAISGYALGGGLELALGCDYRVAGDNAQVGQPEVLLGIIPGAGGTQRLARLVGPSKAKDIIYTGRTVAADEALAFGVVDELVAADDVYTVARQWAQQFETGPALALAAAKRAIDGGIDVDLANGLKRETGLFAALFATNDRTTGMNSFLEHGPGKATFAGQ